jgi:hypothetical protein
MDPSEDASFNLFREILSTPLITKSSAPPAKKRKARGSKSIQAKTTPSSPSIIEERDDAAELGEFIDVHFSALCSSAQILAP